MNNFHNTGDLLPYRLITPNCPDGFTFGSLEQLCIFLSRTCLDVHVKVVIEHPL